ncbi:MsnO8 family LLM class oxidoreductase [Amycolatopsis benzoatilytica]|uniref:MsnO8 family LLM class oxidoreductase n=1 Tax=Amycolatopsis benzoatilytica TaxID=346045 RepID=UPI0003619174|nr:MsnO8 family LLM class oxidoreductase [Amycolatopsis benzoatilytica]
MIVDVPISVLDRSPVRRGRGAAQAIRDTVEFAREIEALGYHRFWVSEHHGVPGVAGSAPAVLASAVASATTRIRVGSGGVMLPNHRPLVVAEQFGILASLFPGRIDLGLGRSVGFTEGVRRALGQDKDAAHGFDAQVRELMSFFRGDYPGMHAVPVEGQSVPIFLLATGAGAALAAELGLPLVIAPARGERAMIDAITRYRANFRSDAADPRVVVSTAVAVASTAEKARRLLVPEAWSTVYSRSHGVFPPLSPAEEILALPMTDRERHRLDEVLAGQISGTPGEVAARLADLVAATGADEVLVSTSTYDPAERVESFAALARLADLPAGHPVSVGA